MSKSLGNYIGIDEPAKEIFGKIMSISDDLMWRYFELLSFNKSGAEQRQMREAVAAGANPRDYKVALAQEIVARFHDQAAAEQCLSDWQQLFQKGAIPDDIEEQTLSVPAEGIGIVALLKASGLVSSNSEANRKLPERAVKIDGEVVEDRERVFSAPAEFVLQLGKRRFVRVILKAEG